MIWLPSLSSFVTRDVSFLWRASFYAMIAMSKEVGGTRQSLVEVRRGLLRLHKALVDSERAAFEVGSGALSNGQFLQLLLQDPYFAWLRPYSTLIAEIDGALAADDGIDSAQASTFVRRVRELVSVTEVNTGADSRYHEVRSRDPDVLFAHAELARRLKDAGAPIG